MNKSIGFAAALLFSLQSNGAWKIDVRDINSGEVKTYVFSEAKPIPLEKVDVGCIFDIEINKKDDGVSEEVGRITCASLAGKESVHLLSTVGICAKRNGSVINDESALMRIERFKKKEKNPSAGYSIFAKCT